MLRWLRRLIWFGFGFSLVIVIVGTGLLWYVRPEQPLDMRYEPFSLRAQLEEMLKTRKLSLQLSEAEINALLKAELARRMDQTYWGGRLEVKGIHFALEAERLRADVHLRLLDRFDAGMQIYYELKWEKPVLSASFESAAIRGWRLPKNWVELPDLAVDLSREFPPVIQVKDIRFYDHRMEILLGLPF